ncbi:uncharacterized protein CPUR_00470 [Claviceps purpurea 20.1]|uniref:HTH CENPB-type domain-containing protein n=1 Tax=Claviceps purpurea (strain 20.1) TaxID=1111077 RepID=M1W516_CLAP2|nr:uncharacterized protein CPUR_00470 [Claviceps purpurea 20.1]
MAPTTPAKPTKRKRVPITIGQRKALRKHHAEYPSLKQTSLAVWFEEQFGHRPSPATISESLSVKFKELDDPTQHFKSSSTKLRKEHWQELEIALLTWRQRFGAEDTITTDLLREVANGFWNKLLVYQRKELPDFNNGWLDKFGKRQDKKHGESGAVDDSAVLDQLIAVRSIIAQYRPEDVYNCDETGLVWNSTLEKALSTQKKAETKPLNSQITALFTCNSTGTDKPPPWFIGNTIKPRAFGRNRVIPSHLECVYKHNGKAWMTGWIFREYLQWFDDYIGQSKPGKEVLLLIDNFSGHVAAVEALDLAQSSLKHIKIEWLPSNIASKYQPLDQGIIKAYKSQYKRRWLYYMLDEYGAGRNPHETMDILKAIKWSLTAWNMVTPQTIADCWYRSTLIARPDDLLRPPVPSQPAQTIECIAEVSALLTELKKRRRIKKAMSVEAFLNPVDELVFDRSVASDDLVDDIASQLNPLDQHQVEDGGEESSEPETPVPIQDVLEALPKIRLLIEQQEKPDPLDLGLLHQLDCFESRLHKRKYAAAGRPR